MRNCKEKWGKLSGQGSGRGALLLQELPAQQPGSHPHSTSHSLKPWAMCRFGFFLSIMGTGSVTRGHEE